MAENEIPISFKWYLNRQGIQGQQGERGEEGFSPTITVNEDTLTAYTLKVQNKTGSFVTPNLRQVVSDSGGTYVRYDRTSGNLYAGNADFATTEQAGMVRFCTEEELNSAYDGSVVSPADLVDYLTNTYQLPIATAGQIGAVKPDGTTITIDPDGTLHGASTYNLPTASATVLGGIKVGDGLSITDDGVLSASGGGGTSLENIKDITNGIQINGFEEVPPSGIFLKSYIQFTTEVTESQMSYTAQIIGEYWENGIKSGSITRNILTDYSVIAGEGINVTKKNAGVEISSATGNLKYSTLTSTEYSELTPDPDTIYKLTDTNKVYLGTIELTGGGASAKQSTFVNYPESSIVKMNALKSETQVASGYPDTMKIVIGDSTSTSYNIHFSYPASSLPNADGTGYTSSGSYSYNLNLKAGCSTGTVENALLYFYNNFVYYTDSLDNIKSYVSGFDASKAIYVGSGSVVSGQLQQLTSVPEYVINNFTGG